MKNKLPSCSLACYTCVYEHSSQTHIQEERKYRMLRAIPSVNTNEILVQGDYRDFESICFVIDQITAAKGASGHKPLPEYAASISLLLGLSYMIRLASRGYCELSVSPNGIQKGWIAPYGTSEEFIAGLNRQEEPDPVVDEIEDAVVRHSGPDLESFYNMSEDDKSGILSDLGFGPGTIARFLQAVKPKEQYLFSHEKYPNVTFYNTGLQFRIRYSEGALYAYILRELLGHREVLLQSMCARAEDSPANDHFSQYRTSCCLLRAKSDLALLEFFMEQLFLCLSGVQDPDLLIPAGTLPPGTSISASGNPVSPGTGPAGGSISASGDSVSPGTGPAGSSLSASGDLFSIYRVYAEIRKKEAPKDFLKNWSDDTLTRVSKLLQAHSDDTVGQVTGFIEDFLCLQ